MALHSRPFPRGTRQGPLHRSALALVTLVLSLTALSSAPSLAQEKRFELTPFAGYQFGGHYDYLDPDFGFTEMRVEPSGSFGVIFDIPVTPSLQVELLYAQQDTNLDLVGFGDLFVDEAGFQLYHAGVLWQWGGGQIHPFVVGTIGLSRVDPGLTRLSAEEFFSFSTGGGVKMMVAHLGFRFEGRFFFTDLGRADRGDPCCCCGGGSQGSGNLFQGQIAAGLILAF